MRRFAPALTAAALAVTVAGCGGGPAGPPSTATITNSGFPTSSGSLSSAAAPASTKTERPPVPLPAEAGHIHGLVVRPDGTLLLGTHAGLYAVGDSAVTKVGDSSDDLMGFTGTSDRLLASGHPGGGSDKPNPLGLMESRDGGITWQTLSRMGESDFHAIAASGQTVYAFDRSLKASTDGGRSWTDRGAVVSPAVLATPPTASTPLLATTADGVQQSTDGGQSFTAISGGLVLQTVTWPTAEVLVGVEPNGRVHVSADGGHSWSSRGEVRGQPHALGADAQTIAIATADAVLASSDGGRTFRTVATAS